MSENKLLERSIKIIKKHLADKTAMDWTSCHIANEMKSIVAEYETAINEPFDEDLRIWTS